MSSLHALSTVFMQAQLIAYHFGMIALGFAGLMLCYVFYRARLVPRLVAVWGLVGYATFLGGSIVAVLGFNLGELYLIPGALWELFIGVWLIAKGFSASPIPAQPLTSPTIPILTSADVGSATT